MAYLDRDGVGIYFEVQGAGPTLLLSHGYSATGAMWQGQLDALADRYHVVVWDLRGHGRSGCPEDPACYSERLCLADMTAILDELGVARAHIGGLSLGGYLSLAFHVEQSDRVHSLLLFDTGPGYRNPAAREQWNELARGRARFFRRKGLGAIEAQFETHGGLHRSAEGLALAAEGILPQQDARVIDSLPGIRVPTLVLAGADDAPFLGPTDYMAAKIPGARRVILSGAGHVANIDQPAAFNRAVGQFLDEVSAG